METTTKVTAQKIHAVLRKAGVTRSTTSSGRIKGWTNNDYGYDLEAHGTTVYICTYCKKTGGHRADCISVTHRAHVKARQKTVNDGTFTLTIRQRTMSRGLDWRTEADCERVEIALNDAGIKFSRTDGHDAMWRIG